MEVKIDTDYIKLDQFIKYIGISQTGGQSKILINEGHVKVNGEFVFERGKKIRRGDIVEIEGNEKYVVV